MCKKYSMIISNRKFLKIVVLVLDNIIRWYRISSILTSFTFLQLRLYPTSLCKYQSHQNLSPESFPLYFEESIKILPSCLIQQLKCQFFPSHFCLLQGQHFLSGIIWTYLNSQIMLPQELRTQRWPEELFFSKNILLASYLKNRLIKHEFEWRINHCKKMCMHPSPNDSRIQNRKCREQKHSTG